MSDPRLTAEALLPGIAFDTLRDLARAEASAHDLAILTDSDARITLDSDYGHFGFRRTETGSMAEVTAPRDDFLQVLKDALLGHLAPRWPDAAQALRWSDSAGEPCSAHPELPSNARLMRLVSCTALGPDFLRVTLAGDVMAFGTASIHFRLGLPPEGRAPVWPRVGANGATVWPKGADALHLPVYTARHVDAAAGRLSFDLFRHAGGRAGHWAETAAPGAEVVIVGPGGGGACLSGPIRGFADETGYPAIARILEENPDLTGDITLYGAAAEGYPLPDSPGVRITREASAAGMADAALGALDAARQGYLWFAGPATVAKPLRTAYKSRFGKLENAYIAAYWS